MPRRITDRNSRGIRPRHRPFRYQIFVDPQWLDESLKENTVINKKHANHKQEINGARKTKTSETRNCVYWRDLTGEREKNYHRVMVQLWLQAYKARRRAKSPDFSVYRIDRAGVPGRGEWICDRTHLIAKPVAQDSPLIQRHRLYYRAVERFSVMAYNYLSGLGCEQFSAMLDAYIRRLIIFPLPFTYEEKRLEAIFDKQLTQTGNYYGKIQCLGGTAKEEALFGQSAQIKMQAVFLNSTSSKQISGGDSASKP
jgi:hypothetical protein